MPNITEPNASGIPAASQSQFVTPAVARTQVPGAKTIGTAYLTQAKAQQNGSGQVSGSVSQIPGGASQFVAFTPGDVTVPDANAIAPLTALGMTTT